MNKNIEQIRKLIEPITKKVEVDNDILGFGKISRFVNTENAIPFTDNAENMYAVHMRVSTDKQATDGESLEMQEQLANALVESRNGTIFKVYLESGVSASKKTLYERKEMMEMLTDFQKGYFKNIISYNQDRLFRNEKEAPIAIRQLTENGANLWFTRGGVNELVNRQTLENNGMITVQIDANRAKQEATITSKRVSDTRLKMFRQGKIVQTYIPYGYIRVKEKGDTEERVIQVPEEIEVIKQVEEFYLNGIGYTTIAKWLNGEKTKKLGQRPTKFIRRKIRKDDSESWTKEIIEQFLFSKFYHGILVNTYQGKEGNEEEVESKEHIPFRTKERYEQIVKFKEEKKAKRKPPRHYDTDFLLKELLFCSHCGEKFYSNSSTKSNGEIHAYYYCKSAVTGRRLGTTICSSKNYNSKMIETFVLLKIKNYLSKFDLSLFTEDMTKSINQEDKRLLLMVEECEKEISQLKDDEEGFDLSIIRLLKKIKDTDDIEMKKIWEEDVEKKEEKMTKIQLEIKRLKENRSQLLEDIENDNSSIMDSTHIFNKMREFVDDFENVADYRKQRLIEELVNKITIDDKGNVEIYYKVDLEELVKSVTEMAVTIQDTFYGDVSELTTPKNGLLENAEKPIYIKDLDHIDDSNYYHWIEEIYVEARSKFKEFLIGTTLKYTENGRINAWQLANKTGISHYTAKAYFNYSHFPTEEKMIQVLKPFDKTPKDFVKFLKLDNYIDSNILFEIIVCVNRWNRIEKIGETVIEKEIEKRVEKYKEKNTLNRQVIYSRKNADIVEEWELVDNG